MLASLCNAGSNIYAINLLGKTYSGSRKNEHDIGMI